MYYGRVKSLNRARGFGFICSDADEKDLYFNANEVDPGPNGEFLCVGSVVSLDMEFNDRGPYAANVRVLLTPDANEYFEIADKQIPIRTIRGFGICHAGRALRSIGVSEDKLTSHSHKMWEVEYLFVSTRDGEYRFFNTGSCVKGDGQVDIKETYDEIQKRFYALDEYEFVELNEDTSDISKLDGADVIVGNIPAESEVPNDALAEAAAEVENGADVEAEADSNTESAQD